MFSDRYKFLGDYPFNCNRDWCDNLQGVAHDKDYWYITNTTQLWKFPVEFKLGTDFDGDHPPPGVQRTGIPKELSTLGYNHFGDLDHHNGYLFVPFEHVNASPAVPRAALAVFKAENLAYLGHAVLSQEEAGWCAINPANGWLYSSSGYAAKADDPNYYIHVYYVRVKENPSVITLIDQAPLRIYNENGGPITLSGGQGGTFSEDGQLLYLVSGGYDTEQPEDGISVFDTMSGKRVAKSTNGAEPFNYEWHPGTIEAEEPEGLMVWDLDKDTRAPGIRGQLHVIMLDNELLGNDYLHFKHYRFEGPPIAFRGRQSVPSWLSVLL